MRQLGQLNIFATMIVACSFSTFAFAAPMVTNGDFEADIAGFVTWPGYVENGDNPVNISGWTGSGGRGINPIASEHDNPAPFRDNGDNDTHVAFLQGDASIEQEITGFAVGTDYVLSLDYNSRNCCGDQPIGSVALDGTVIVMTDGGVAPVGDVNAWYHADIPFTAGEEAITLNISTMSAAGGDSTLLVDNISVNVVPEPSSVALIGLGIVGLATLRRRRSS